MQLRRALLVTLAGIAALAVAVPADGQPGIPRRALPCPDCAAWNAPHAPFRIHGNSWYVGTNGLAAILITSPEGHVLIDGALPESAARIAANIRALGFRLEDVKLIVNSHVHFDHAGGIAELQRRSGARVAATAPSAAVLRTGRSGPDDPSFGVLPDIAPVAQVRVVRDGETLLVGPVSLTAHLTAGHTPGGTTWVWESCEETNCRALVYADSQTPISADGFLYTASTTYPNAIADFRRGHEVLERLRCDILLTPHPGASELWERLAKRERGEGDALVDRSACRRYAATARDRLMRRVATEREQR